MFPTDSGVKGGPWAKRQQRGGELAKVLERWGPARWVGADPGLEAGGGQGWTRHPRASLPGSEGGGRAGAAGSDHLVSMVHAAP